MRQHLAGLRLCQMLRILDQEPLEKKQFLYQHPFPLESGEILPEFELSYTTWGQLQYDTQGKPSNVVWICHALTANAEASDWWDGLVGMGKIYDPTQHYIVCVNMLGSCYGSTNALSIHPQTGRSYYYQFPSLTIRDIVKAMDLLRIELGIRKIHLCTGGSMGGQQAMEWAIIQPDLIENLALLATNAQHSPWGIAFNESQRMAIRTDPTWGQEEPEAGKEGLKTARSIALLSYRNYQTYQATQAEETPQKIQDFKAASYQRYQGEKLARRFHAFAYMTLSSAMDTHHVGRNRGGSALALQSIKARTLIIGIDSDQLFPTHEQKFLAAHIPCATYHEIHSPFGHDGFLIESEQISELMSVWLSEVLAKR